MFRDTSQLGPCLEAGGSFWKPPKSSVVKVNFDGSFQSAINKVAASFIIRNEKGSAWCC